jgi:hypothetical protein
LFTKEGHFMTVGNDHCHHCLARLPSYMLVFLLNVPDPALQ